MFICGSAPAQSVIFVDDDAPGAMNGGVFLGLNGTVVKSHGSADATGVSAAVKLAFQLAQIGFTDKLAARVAAAGVNSDSGAGGLDPDRREAGE